jgi:hypothetical protein
MAFNNVPPEVECKGGETRPVNYYDKRCFHGRLFSNLMTFCLMQNVVSPMAVYDVPPQAECRGGRKTAP